MFRLARYFGYLVGASGLVVFNAVAQYPGSGSGGTTGGSAGATSESGAAAGYNFNSNYHVGFNRPEAWGLKYFASATLLNGLQPPEASEDHRVGSISIAMELGWLPTLNEGQSRIGFNGKAPEDLNQTHVLIRPVVRIGLPDKFTALIAAPPPFEVWGLTPRLVAFGLERPLVERGQWAVNWRGYGQLGWIKGAFTCPNSVLSFAPGSPQNPTECVGQSQDKASLRYAGMEFQVAHKLRRAPKLTPHVAVAANFIDGVFQVHAPLQDGLDHTRMWTRGGTFSSSGGISYAVRKNVGLVFDVFYTPLWVQRASGAPTTNDGLFNVRALVSYTFR
jgi:hypothetical protein